MSTARARAACLARAATWHTSDTPPFPTESTQPSISRVHGGTEGSQDPSNRRSSIDPLPHIHATIPDAYNPNGSVLLTSARIFPNTGTITASRPLVVLVDTGFSGHMLLSERVAAELHLQTTPIKNPIKLANGTIVNSASVAKNIQISLGDTNYCEHANLHIFPLASYDLIVGMAWLHAHKATIDCSAYSVTFTHSLSDYILHGSAPSNTEPQLSILHDVLLTCNQLKRLVRDPDAETMAVFLVKDKDNNITFSTETDLEQAHILHSTEHTLSTLEARLQHVPPEIKVTFASMLKEYESTVFADREYCSVESALNRDVEHEINEEPGHAHPYKGVYRLSPPMLDELRTQLDALLKGGLIRPSMSPYGAPVLFAKKKDGGWRMCIDYRALNKITIKDRFPLPRAEDLFDQLDGAKYFTKIDLRWGYHQIKIRKEDIQKSAFRCPLGSYEWLVMPFGLTNAPATFQRFVQRILHDFIGKFACVYMDDMLIYSKTAEDHVSHVRQVLDTLKHHELLAKPSKCEFFTQQVEYLGHIVGGQGVQVDPSKVEAIANWPDLHTKTEVRSFLGLANYYRRFIHDFSSITAPLSALTHDDSPDRIPWGAPQQMAFAQIKTALTNAPVLRTYDRNLTCTVVITDASSSHTAIGGVLMQDDGHGARPIAYYSRKMTTAEIKYTTREQELLAIKDCLKQWKHYLLGLKFTIYSDHESLRYIRTQNDLEGKLLRWNDFLQLFDFDDIKYLPGNKNPVGDALSRPPIRNTLSVLLSIADTPSELYTLTISSSTSDLIDRIRLATTTDKEFGPTLEIVQQPHFDPTTHKFRGRYSAHDGCLMWNDKTSARFCIPASLRPLLLNEFHDSPSAGHLGADKTYALMRKYFYWNRMYEDICAYIRSCNTCQYNKATNVAPAGLAQPIPPPDHNFDTWGLDFITGLPPTHEGYNCIVVFIDHKSKLLKAFPAVSSKDPRDKDNPLSAEAVAEIYFQHIFRNFGLCKSIVSDRDSRFVSRFWTELHRLCNTRLHMSTAFRPQTDGLTERANRTLIEVLKTTMMDIGGAWAAHLAFAEFAINNSESASTGFTPFFLTSGRHPRVPGSVHTSTPEISDILLRIETARLRAEDNMLRTQISQIEQMDAHRRVSPFRVNDLVYLSTRHLSLSGPPKFCPRYIGPLRITALSGKGNAARLDLPPAYIQRRVHPVFHVSLLKPYSSRPSPLGLSRVLAPPPLSVDPDGTRFALDFVVACQVRGRGKARGKHLLVRWKGYGPQDDTWEPYATILADCPEEVVAFEAKHRDPASTMTQRFRK